MQSNIFKIGPTNIFLDIFKNIIKTEDEYFSIYPFIIQDQKNKFTALGNILNTNKQIFSSLKVNFDIKLTPDFVQSISQENKELIFTYFYKTQKIIHAFYKIMFLYRYRKSTIKNDKDLSWNDIHLNDKNTIMLYHAKSNYLFTLRDLKNIIEKALSNTDNFFSHSLESKNPFNNLPFTKSNLYNIYFALLRSNYKISVLFHQYYLCHFDLELFEIENEFLIRDYAITNYINNSTNYILHEKIIQMLFQYNRKISVDEGFPEEKLIAIMKPYLYLYIIITSHIEGIEKKENSRILLKKMLIQFYNFNPNFGKKQYFRDSIHDSAQYAITYNTNHLKFTMGDIKKLKYNYYNMDNSMRIPAVQRIRIQQSPTPPSQHIRFQSPSPIHRRDPNEIDIDEESMTFITSPFIYGFEREDDSTSTNPYIFSPATSGIIIPGFLEVDDDE